MPIEHGKDRLRFYSQARPLEGWAGPVANAAEIEKIIGVSQKILGKWLTSWFHR